MDYRDALKEAQGQQSRIEKQTIAPCKDPRQGLLVLVIKGDTKEVVANLPLRITQLPDRRTGDKGYVLHRNIKPGDYTVTIRILPGNLKDEYILPDPSDVAVAPGKCPIKLFILKPVSKLLVKVFEGPDPSSGSGPKTPLDGVIVRAKPSSSPALPNQTSAKKTGLADFGVIAPETYGVSVAFSDPADAEFYRLPKLQEAVVKMGETKELEFVLVPVLRIRLQLRFKDPENGERKFPKGFLCKLNVQDGLPTIEAEVGDNGILMRKGKTGPSDPAYIEMERKAALKSVSLNFKQAECNLIKCEKQGAASKTEELVEESALNRDDLTLYRAFQLPRPAIDWTLDNSDWEHRDAPAYNAPEHKFKGLESSGTVIGTAAAPAKLILKPKWQFTRFVYYDRWIKGADRISIPPVMLEGYAVSAVSATPPDTASNWIVGADDKQTCLSLPWIIQVAGTPKPDAQSMLQFKTKDDTFIETATDKSSRVLVDGTARNTPNKDRLRYYDLPKLWRAQHYYCRLTADQGFFDDDDMVSKATTAANPLTFCLDDLVLFSGIGGALAPLPALAATDHVAIFNHRFDKTEARHASCTTHGLYTMLSPPATADYSPASDITVVSPRNYIHDYPDWTRLVIAQGSLFDVFNQRTPDAADPAQIIGARAAVRWVDATDTIAGINRRRWAGAGWSPWVSSPPEPGYMISGVPPRTDDPSGGPFFSVQPYYQQRTSVRYRELFNPAHDEQGGRFDIALLRCCDVEGNDELAVNLHFLKSSFDFTQINADSPPQLTTPAEQANYAKAISMNVAKRWNGNDPGVNDHRAELLPQIPSPPAPLPELKVSVVWFPQSVPVNRAHYKVDIQDIERDNRGGQTGSGASGPGSVQETPGLNHWYPAAHESGHMDGLPDEYNERWWGASYDQLSFKQNLPGDPYEPDGRDETGDKINSPMMNGNRMMRNRYFWHAAEWVRTVTKVPMRVKYHTWDNYFLPAHPQFPDGRTYYPWPIAHRTIVAAAGAFTYDLYLFRLGKEEYSESLLPNAPVDGALVIATRLDCWLPLDPTPADETYYRTEILTHIAAATRQFMNNRWYASGDVPNVGSPPQTVHFDKCALQFTPQYLATRHSPPAGTELSDLANQIAADLPPHDLLTVQFFNSPPHQVVDAPGREVTINMNTQFNEIDPLLAEALPQIWGITSPPNLIDASSWEPVVQNIIPGATVQKLP